ncbi:MAG: SRPBCC family protein [Cycloclasticus sp.]|nr:SRPBCC family protein [Cycloclasticus sp.]
MEKLIKENVAVELDINASSNDAWDLIGPFETMQSWLPGIIDTQIEGSGIGTIRHLTMPGGAVYSDKLTEQGDKYYRYIIVGGDVPFENYLGTVSVVNNQDASILKYHASIDVSEENREASVAFLTELYSNAFNNVKDVLEKK